MCEKLKFEKLAYEGEVGRIMKEQILHDMCEEYVLVGEERTAHSKYFPKYANDIENFEVRNDDVFVASYPKAGGFLGRPKALRSRRVAVPPRYLG